MAFIWEVSSLITDEALEPHLDGLLQGTHQDAAVGVSWDAAGALKEGKLPQGVAGEGGAVAMDCSNCCPCGYRADAVT